MKPLLLLLFPLLLSGCYWNQKQEFAACASEAGRRTPRQDVPTDYPPPGYDYVEACMRAHGYELNPDQCPVLRDDSRLDPAAIATLGEKQARAYTEETEKRDAALAAWRKTEPTCYEPKDAFGKRLVQIEKWLGIRK
jgi:hypothetical protein